MTGPVCPGLRGARMGKVRKMLELPCSTLPGRACAAATAAPRADHATRRALRALTAAALALAIASPATAQTLRCGDRTRLLELLEIRLGETRRGTGIAGGNAVMELFASSVTGSWTITVTLPGGQMCLLASGHGFDGPDGALPDPGTPA